MISVKDLTLKFDHRGIAGLGGISFDLAKGSILGIVGPNGSGKTTLLNILSGQLKQDAGTISSSDKFVFFHAKNYSEQINVQKFLVDSVTLDIEPEKKIQLARDLADTFEFTFQLRQNLHEVSSGQRQKILLAKELINQPSVILMDEPFTHLDPFMRVSILSDLFRFIKSREMTVIWVTHDLNEALKFSNKIAVMNFGKFEQFGSPIELMKSPKNLFVAKFLGYKNFFAIKEQQGKWSTPWGERPKSEKYSEGILVVPDHAWMMSEGVLVTLMETIVGIQSLVFVMDYEGREIFWQRSITETDTFKTTHLTPRWADCFVIPL